MDKNLIPEIARMLGVELGEEFKVVSKEGNEQICNFTMAGLFEHDNKESGSYNKELLAEIVCNNAEIVKMPWKPKREGTFWTFCINGDDGLLEVDWYVWHEDVDDLARLKAGWVYRTKEEAYAALPAVAKEVGVEYELSTSDTEAVEPWKPKKGDIYYSFNLVYGIWVVCQHILTGSPFDYALLDKGWVYSTCEEAQAALPKVAAELGVEYKI